MAVNGRLLNINPDFISPESLKGWDDYSKLPPEYISYIPIEEFKMIDIGNFSKEQLLGITKEQINVLPMDKTIKTCNKYFPEYNLEAIRKDALESGALGAGIGAAIGATAFGAGAIPGAVFGGLAGTVAGGVGEIINQTMVHNGYSEETAQYVEIGINLIPAGGAKTLLKEGGEEVLKHGDEILKGTDEVTEIVSKNGDEIRTLKELSPYSHDITKSIRNIDELKVYQDAKLEEGIIHGRLALKDTKIDLSLKDGMGKTNPERMQQGKPPIDSEGNPYNLHHIGQEKNSPLAELKNSTHKTNDAILHDKSKPTEIHGDNSTWNKERSDYWKARAEELGGKSNV